MTLASLSEPLKSATACPVLACTAKAAAPSSPVRPRARLRLIFWPWNVPLPETLTAPSGPVKRSALTLVNSSPPSPMLALAKCACSAASQAGGATARGPPGSGQGNFITGLSRLSVCTASWPRSRAGSEISSARALALMTSWSGPPMVMREAVSRGRGRISSVSLPAICTSRPVSAEAKRSMAGRWLCEATKPGSASSVPMPTARMTAGTNQRSFLLKARHTRRRRACG
jgi:hypothetical protein